jgi:hypothetical protein
MVTLGVLRGAWLLMALAAVVLAILEQILSPPPEGLPRFRLRRALFACCTFRRAYRST